MSSVDFDFSQVDRLAVELVTAGPRVKALAQAELSVVANRVSSDAKMAAPVDTGTLRNSITVSGEGDERVVETNAPYAMFVEFGTSVMGPQPFMWPAASTAEKVLMEAIEKIASPLL